MSGGTGVVGPLPDAVRARLIALSSEVLGALPPEEVPATLRPFARWEPRRRAKLARSALAATLEADPGFRQKVGAHLADVAPQLTDALGSGVIPAAADPVEVAAAAYLLRPEGWTASLRAADERLANVRAGRREAEVVAEHERLLAELERLRIRARDDVAAAESAGERDRLEVVRLQAELGRAKESARLAVAEATRLRVEAEDAAAMAAQELKTSTAERRTLRSRVAELEQGLGASRRADQSDRADADLRTRLLLDTIVEASTGLRRELGLAPVQRRPADAVAAEFGAEPSAPGTSDVPVRAHADGSVHVLDQLLALPKVHLLVDGYNVTKSGFGTLPLEVQRQRLVTGLAGLAASTGAEVTCVFDGADVGLVPTLAAPRGVRVLFSRAGMSADELIRRIVRAEPAGRPVVVVSTDREVADGVLGAGARPVPSATLLARLARS